MHQYPFSFCLHKTYLRRIFMKGDRPLDKCKDTIFKRILQKRIDSTINEYTNLFESGYITSCGSYHDALISGQS
jgi:hypothetical protein